MMIATISSRASATMRADAAKDPGREACGLLLGPPRGNRASGGAVDRIKRPAHADAVTIDTALATANVAADPARSFEIDPAALLRVHRQARSDGAAIVGHYHSHPNGDGRPSKRDAARATQNGQIWMIIANGALHAWRAVADDPAALHGRFLTVTILAQT
jgi:proteasome lid subunit RPN8/RPN11